MYLVRREALRSYIKQGPVVQCATGLVTCFYSAEIAHPAITRTASVERRITVFVPFSTPRMSRKNSLAIPDAPRIARTSAPTAMNAIGVCHEHEELVFFLDARKAVAAVKRSTTPPMKAFFGSSIEPNIAVAMSVTPTIAAIFVYLPKKIQMFIVRLLRLQGLFLIAKILA